MLSTQDAARHGTVREEEPPTCQFCNEPKQHRTSGIGFICMCPDGQIETSIRDDMKARKRYFGDA